MKGIGNIKSKETQTASKKANLVQSEIKKEEEKIGFWGKVKNFFKSVVNGIKGLWNKIFGGEKEDDDACLTPFQKILKHGKYSKIGNMEKKFDYWIPRHEKISAKEAFIDPTTKLQDYAQVSLNDERTNVLEAPMNKQGIPGVIWEVAFMSAAKGRERMKDPTTMKNYANLITQAVIEYFN